MEIPNFSSLSSEEQRLASYIIDNLEFSLSQTTVEAFIGFRSVQINELAHLISAYAQLYPTVGAPEALPELPAAPSQWTTSDIHAAVKFFYGSNFSITEGEASDVLQFLVIDYSTTNEPITWAKVQETLQALANTGDINPVITG